jgi:hypothetical protein
MGPSGYPVALKLCNIHSSSNFVFSRFNISFFLLDVQQKISVPTIFIAKSLNLAVQYYMYTCRPVINGCYISRDSGRRALGLGIAQILFIMQLKYVNSSIFFFTGF